MSNLFKDNDERLFNSVKMWKVKLNYGNETFTQRQKLSVIYLKLVEKVSVCTVISLVVLTSQLQ